MLHTQDHNVDLYELIQAAEDTNVQIDYFKINGIEHLEFKPCNVFGFDGFTVKETDNSEYDVCLDELVGLKKSKSSKFSKKLDEDDLEDEKEINALLSDIYIE